jgi:hypothetical protein
MFKSKLSNIAKAEISKGLNLHQVLTISLPIAVSQVQHLFLKCKLYNQKKKSSGYANPFININGIQSHIYSIKKHLTQETLNVDGRIEPKHS